MYDNFPDVNECSCNLCQNGGSCYDSIDLYNCTCLPGYEGMNCENVERLDDHILNPHFLIHCKYHIYITIKFSKFDVIFGS